MSIMDTKDIDELSKHLEVLESGRYNIGNFEITNNQAILNLAKKQIDEAIKGIEELIDF